MYEEFLTDLTFYLFFVWNREAYLFRTQNINDFEIMYPCIF